MSPGPDLLDGFPAAARRTAELLIEIFTGLEARRVDPGARREAMGALFGGTLGQDDGIGIAATLEEFARNVLPNSMGTPHPLYLGLVNSSPLPAGPLADALVSALNNNGGAFHQSPAMSAAEAEVVRAFAERLGLPPSASGMLLPGGTYANLQGLFLARSRRFPEWGRSGPLALGRRPVLYTSEASHFSIARSAKVLGLGAEGVVAIPAVGRGELDPQALEKRIAGDRAGGAEPFAVAATAGTTGTGAIDPLDELADLCAREALWLHVDACYGGAASLSEALRPRLAGLARADSVAVDPHKWFFIPMTAGLLLTRHPELEAAAFETASASYIPRDDAVDPFLRGVPTSRRSSGLTVWMALRAHGWRTVREAVERNCALTRKLEQRLAAAGFDVLPGGELSIACARWVPPAFAGASPEKVDALQRRIADEVVASGTAWFATVSIRGRTWLRFNMVNLYTRAEHVDVLAELLERTVRRLAPANGPSAP